MDKKKQTYVKPEMTIIPADSQRYKEIMALLKTEDDKSEQQENIPPPTKAK